MIDSSEVIIGDNFMVEGNGDVFDIKKVVEQIGSNPDVDESLKPLPKAREVDREVKIEMEKLRNQQQKEK